MAAQPASIPAANAAEVRMGNGRFFATENFNFQTLRALMEAPSGSADVNEVLEALKLIVDGDTQSWYAQWSALAERVLALAERTRDPISKGNAYLRSYSYQRTAEFPLSPGDPKRVKSWADGLARFDKALETLGVACERMNPAYEGGKLRVQYFPGRPGAEQKPLIMLVGGYDSVLEELYPLLGKAALERGYSVLAYEGPGQGQPLRDGLTFTPEWERPTGVVLDAFLRTHAKPKEIVLIGMSMGGYFAPRAAAFEKWIDGVVAWDTCYDYGEVVRLMTGGMASLRPADKAWFSNNARWTLGVGSVEDAVREFGRYTLAPVAKEITQPVLIMAGEHDYAIPLRQTADFARALVNAKSVTTKTFDLASGGAEHCQTGNVTLVHATIFDWILANFG